MTPALRVLDAGLGNTVQDLGRTGKRHWGIAVAGALDHAWAVAANTLLGNAPDAALLELRLMGPRLQAERAAVRVAIVGGVVATVERLGGAIQPLPGWCTVTMYPGDVLRLGAVQGLAYIALSGGIHVPPVFGSRATHERTAMGGLDGRSLRPGDLLPSAAPAPDERAPERRGPPLSDDESPIRVIHGPQDDHFLPEALDVLCRADWRVTNERDRMGIRLSGPALQHCTPAHADIVSDGVVPGAIQVPASGQPIVLLADAQTVGGYPKIATVISADLGRLARWPIERPLRFVAVDLSQAHAALRAQAESLQRWAQALQPWHPPGYVDLRRLYECNLISGMLCARIDEPLCARPEGWTG